MKPLQHVVVPAAGESSRFRAAGYSTPKPLLCVDYRGTRARMLDHVLQELYLSSTMFRVHVGIPPGWTYATGGQRAHTIHETSAHTDTVRQLLDHVPDDEPVVVVDCDVLIRSHDFHSLCRVLETVRPEVPVVLVSSRVQVPGRLSYLNEFPRILTGMSIGDADHCTGYAVWSLRAYPTAGGLKEWMGRHPRYTSMDAYLEHGFYAEPTLAVEAVHTPVDWGTPEALERSGARIVV